MKNFEYYYEIYRRVPEWVKVAAWVGFSAAVTAIGAYILERPELAQYYGIVNVILFALKEVEKKRREDTGTR
jgi:hypothetical protein